MGCQTSDEAPINLASMHWGKQQLISTILTSLDHPDSSIINRISVKVQSDRSELPKHVQKPEGFSISIKDEKISIVGYDTPGALYGCLELGKRIKENGFIPKDLKIIDAPVMKLRGTCILLMKLGTYNYPITPKTFPFFYEKKLWIEYLDFLAENRYNYIAFWNGHPFDYFVKLEKYPEAQDGMSADLIEKNKNGSVRRVKKEILNSYFNFITFTPLSIFKSTIISLRKFQNQVRCWQIIPDTPLRLSSGNFHR
jgi:hypothetical protein